MHRSPSHHSAGCSAVLAKPHDAAAAYACVRLPVLGGGMRTHGVVRMHVQHGTVPFLSVKSQRSRKELLQKERTREIVQYYCARCHLDL
jgi:hypothetical protein